MQHLYLKVSGNFPVPTPYKEIIAEWTVRNSRILNMSLIEFPPKT